jgi:hypothetical protein
LWQTTKAFRKPYRHNSVLISFTAIPQNKPVNKSIRNKQEVRPGYDDNGDGPIGCFVTKDDLPIDDIFRKMGWSGIEDHAEV